MIKDDPEAILWANEHLVKAVSWQDHPDIYHPDVKLGGEFSIFYPDWAHELCLPNELNKEELINLVQEYVKEL
jgi:DNA polymerase-1